MRIIVYLLLSMFIGLFTAKAQESKTTTSNTTTSVSISTDGDIGFTENGRTYFSISDSDDTYKVRAEFHTTKTKKIRTYLLEELGKEYLTTSGNRQKWIRTYGGDVGYEVRLDNGTLKIRLDKELLSSGMVNKFKIITQNIKAYTSGKSQEKYALEQAEREAEQVQREAEQKKREAEQLQREAEQKIREAEQLQREAERIKREAKRKKGTR